MVTRDSAVGENQRATEVADAAAVAECKVGDACPVVRDGAVRNSCRPQEVGDTTTVNRRIARDGARREREIFAIEDGAPYAGVATRERETADGHVDQQIAAVVDIENAITVERGRQVVRTIACVDREKIRARAGNGERVGNRGKLRRDVDRAGDRECDFVGRASAEVGRINGRAQGPRAGVVQVVDRVHGEHPPIFERLEAQRPSVERRS